MERPSVKKSPASPRFTVREILARFKELRNPRNIAGMARFGIDTEKCFGVPIPVLRGMAKEIGRDQALSLELWSTGVHEARLLAGFIGDPARVTERQMDRWAKDFNSWDICDQVCSNLFDPTPFAHAKAMEWSRREEEFVRRAGYVMMAALAVHDKKSADERFLPFLARIREGADDDRNFVRKAVNWALRQIGKRNVALRARAVKTAEAIRKDGSRAGRWIAADALRELESEAVVGRLRARAARAAKTPA